MHARDKIKQKFVLRSYINEFSYPKKENIVRDVIILDGNGSKYIEGSSSPR